MPCIALTSSSDCLTTEAIAGASGGTSGGGTAAELDAEARDGTISDAGTLVGEEVAV